jgi:hypothetical protein
MRGAPFVRSPLHHRRRRAEMNDRNLKTKSYHETTPAGRGWPQLNANGRVRRHFRIISGSARARESPLEGERNRDHQREGLPCPR